MSPLTGKVLSVQFHGGFPAASQGCQVRGPHWEEDLALLLKYEDGSRQPAVYRRGTPVQATVEVDLTEAGSGGTPGLLRGQIGSLTLQGSISLANGPQTVSVSQRVAPDIGDAITRHRGDVTWSIHTASLPRPIALVNTTRLEIFAVLAEPAPFFTQGVWVEALRLLTRQAGPRGAGLDGVSDPRVALRRIAEYCHGRHGLSYPTLKADSRYNVTMNGGSFDLSAFLALLHPQANCFDMAASVLVLAGAVGVPASWLRVDFGHIVQTDLMGIGPCNSPGFSKEGTGPLVCSLDPLRTRFEMHGFCEGFGKIFDACIGPHVGNKARQDYLLAAVDPNNPDSAIGYGKVPSKTEIRVVQNAIKSLI